MRPFMFVLQEKEAAELAEIYFKAAQKIQASVLTF